MKNIIFILLTFFSAFSVQATTLNNMEDAISKTIRSSIHYDDFDTITNLSQKIYTLQNPTIKFIEQSIQESFTSYALYYENVLSSDKEKSQLYYSLEELQHPLFHNILMHYPSLKQDYNIEEQIRDKKRKRGRESVLNEQFDRRIKILDLEIQDSFNKCKDSIAKVLSAYVKI